MTTHPNETPEPLAGPSVESCATALAEALRREKGWLLDYGHSVIRDAIDRKHLEPLAQEQMGEMEHGGELGMVESHPNYVAGFKAGHAAGRKRATAALQAKDAEIAGLKADAGRLDWLSGRDLNDLAVGCLEGKVLLNIGCGDIFEGDDLRGAIDHARKYGQPS